MPLIKSSIGEQALSIITRALKTGEENGIDGNDKLKELAIKTNSLISLIYCYTCIEDSTIDNDDEIINWTIPDVGYDFASTLLNLACGLYKTGASCQRGAIEMAIVSLYFQILENEFSGTGYNPKFNAWDGGDDSTPNWGTTKPKIKNHNNVKEFKIQYGYCPIDEVYKHFKYLCSFTHSRSISHEDGKGTNAMNMKNHPGEFHIDEFNRISELMDETISSIAATWSIVYPQIIYHYLEGNIDSEFCAIEKLYNTVHSEKAYEFAKNKTKEYKSS